MNKDAKIYIAGHRGLVGSAIIRALKDAGYSNILIKTHTELDLTQQQAVRAFFESERPEYVFLAAAKVGGILANRDYPADFIRENLQIETNVIESAHAACIEKLLFLGTSCIYPKLAPQPIREEYLMTGPLEETNRAYAIAKIAGIEMCQAYHRQYGSRFISAMPTNLYGPNDNFHPQNSHVLPALIRRFHDAKVAGDKEVVVWGTGAPLREFLHVDDLGRACAFLMEKYEDSSIINIGTGEEISIDGLAGLVKKTVGYSGAITWDSSRPDGTQRKLLDISKIHRLGWKHEITLSDGLAQTYKWFINNAKTT